MTDPIHKATAAVGSAILGVSIVSLGYASFGLGYGLREQAVAAIIGLIVFSLVIRWASR